MKLAERTYVVALRIAERQELPSILARQGLSCDVISMAVSRERGVILGNWGFQFSSRTLAIDRSLVWVMERAALATPSREANSAALP